MLDVEYCCEMFVERPALALLVLSRSKKTGGSQAVFMGVGKLKGGSVSFSPNIFACATHDAAYLKVLFASRVVLLC